MLPVCIFLARYNVPCSSYVFFPTVIMSNVACLYFSCPLYISNLSNHYGLCLMYLCLAVMSLRLRGLRSAFPTTGKRSRGLRSAFLLTISYSRVVDVDSRPRRPVFHRRSLDSPFFRWSFLVVFDLASSVCLNWDSFPGIRSFSVIRDELR